MLVDPGLDRVEVARARVHDLVGFLVLARRVEDERRELLDVVALHIVGLHVDVGDDQLGVIGVVRGNLLPGRLEADAMAAPRRIVVNEHVGVLVLYDLIMLAANQLSEGTSIVNSLSRSDIRLFCPV